MSSLIRILAFAPAMVAVAYGQGVILSAQGEKGSPASLPLQVDLTKSDANIIRTEEIDLNVSNECGRTLLAGNIDIGQNTENQIAAKTITSVTQAGSLTMKISELNADGEGPFTCDMDQTSNSLGSGQTPLDVKESSAGGITTLTLTMPADMACIGGTSFLSLLFLNLPLIWSDTGSTGTICTIRCFNTAAAGPFGGCVSVSQSDKDPNVNTADNIETEQTLAGVNSQIANNIKALPATISAIAEAKDANEQGVLAVDNVLGIDSVALATAGVPIAAASATAAAAVGTGKGGKTGKKGGRKGSKGKNNKRAVRNFIAWGVLRLRNSTSLLQNARMIFKFVRGLQSHTLLHKMVGERIGYFRSPSIPVLIGAAKAEGLTPLKEGH
jgi:hypothetical protein